MEECYFTQSVSYIKDCFINKIKLVMDVVFFKQFVPIKTFDCTVVHYCFYSLKLSLHITEVAQFDDHVSDAGMDESRSH